ncbi:P-loop containing nucleoside triphosphate hydrolase protein [Neocallimastix lanati (nom. inval.)]|jgi:ABC-type multidrug transport system fused ATPase/permease subunit|uniref:p-loop containing nucleoside triphosphate hydrolase protein n=1 Tax=Neocallimastix californiae TaxID=1754190 RepID=A0A1Y2AXM0_9FUNG|nr:P-loop containing nucleoside triphosphate hydrolase protein [Neocallimastix sp. JGI-2020a]ORY27236.1 P-loop containing nucleoside triphosphate hydrolase protein [Neocallimastix californiae]|eukprot:ORY27236.1 P-loop containing nucleoside triphosphate hydrolase protein [Neocallimastix californiae]
MGLFGKKKIIPVPDEPRENPYVTASWFSRITYSWENPIFKIGFNRPLQKNDLFLLHPKFREEVNEQNFYSHWKNLKYTQDDKANVLKALWKVFGREYSLAGINKLFADISSVLSPVILEMLLDYLETDDILKPPYEPGSWREKINPYMGWIYICGIFFLQIVYAFCSNYYSKTVLEVGMSVRATIIGMIYKKTFKLSNKEMQTIGEGQIVNMLSSDSSRIQLLLSDLHYIWSSPLKLTFALILLVRSLGIWSLIGFSLFVIIVPLQGVVMKLLISLRKNTAIFTDDRVKRTQEIIGNIRVIKFFGWEKKFFEMIDDLREKELKCTKKNIIINAGSYAIFSVVPFFASALTFIAYSAAGNELTAAKVFSSHALFNMLRSPLTNLSAVFNQLTNGIVGMKRLNYLMNAKELDDITEIDPTADFGVSVRNGQFNWEVVRPEDVHKKAKKEKKLTEKLKRMASRKKKRANGEEPREPMIKKEKKKPVLENPELTKLKKKGNRYSRLLENQNIIFDSTDCLVGTSNLNGNINTDDMIEKTASIDNLRDAIKDMESFRLRDINIRIKKGSLTAVVGTVGSGKSSLINAIIGEMKREAGRVIIGGTFSYCSQKAWIRNATVRDNITFGRQFDKERYDRAVRDCALLRDFDIFPNGDMTEIGERGSNLSGGQKQRINLARAVYNDSDVVFMDDPLSAVDAHVSRYLFDNCINGAMANKTRVLVTHQLHVLPKVDYVIVMKNGYIEEQGEYKELMQKNGELARLMSVYGECFDGDEDLNDDSDDSSESCSDVSQSCDREAVKPDEKKEKAKVQGLMKDEERATGAVKWRIYSAYIKAGGGFIIGFIIILLIGFIQLSKIGSDMWLVFWTDNEFGLTVQNYILIYFAWNAGQSLLTFIYYVYMANVGIKSSRNVHRKAIDNVMKAPILFFDTNPLGRIINRFSMDQDALDNNLFLSLQVFFTSLASTISTLVLMIYAAPVLGIALGPLLILYMYIQQMFRCTSRELKRMDALARSPLYANISETINGLPTIRAYHEEESLIKHNQFLVDENNRPLHLQNIAKKWLAFRLEIIGAFLIFFDGAAGLLLKDSLSTSLLGLSLSYALSVTSSLNYTVRYFCDTEVYMNSAERVLHYANDIETENQKGRDAPLGWPYKGRIEIRNLTMRYAPYLPPTIRDVSLDIDSHEKVGIVGRTGAGKSSIIMTLFRMVEPELYSMVRIDDESIMDMRLNDLRRGISIIPQEPILFSGTIRFNMDPFNEHSDDDIWYALENSGMKQFVKDMDKQLDSEVRPNGENFSVGQRQLLCLARAMIRGSHILIMDEATASVDIETDAIIQRALRTNFSEATVLTIAHRLNTIIDYDKILVLDKGELLEFDSPKNLLFEKNENGDLVPTNKTEFSKLVDETGPSSAEALRRAALEKQ